MAVHLSGGSGCVVVLAILFVPAAALAYFLNDSKWLVIVPVAIAAIALLIAALPIKRKVTPEQWALELEPHLLGTEGTWDWDDATSIALANPELERVRRKLHKFDTLPTDERRKQFESIIAALKRGELPALVTIGDKSPYHSLGVNACYRQQCSLRRMVCAMKLAAVVLVSLLSPLCLAQTKPLSVCDILNRPTAWNNNVVLVRARYGSGMEDSFLYDERCPSQEIWFDYPQQAAEDDVLSKDTLANRQTPVTLKRDKQLEDFERDASLRDEKNPMCQRLNIFHKWKGKAANRLSHQQHGSRPSPPPRGRRHPLLGFVNESQNERVRHPTVGDHQSPTPFFISSVILSAVEGACVLSVSPRRTGTQLC